MNRRALRRRFGHSSGEPWKVAQERLLALPPDASDAQVSHALEPIGLGGHGGYPASLAGHEANRVIALLDAERVKRAALAQAREGEHYNATKLVRAVHAARGAKRAASGERSQRTAALKALPDEAQRRLEFARHVEAVAVDKARAMESLAKQGVSPAWAAKVARKTAREETRRREKLEDELLRGGR